LNEGIDDTFVSELRIQLDPLFAVIIQLAMIATGVFPPRAVGRTGLIQSSSATTS
jgi:hypothetical protein